MTCQVCGIEFHKDHGCGKAVLCGSSYAEHIMGCPKSIMYTGLDQCGLAG